MRFAFYRRSAGAGLALAAALAGSWAHAGPGRIPTDSDKLPAGVAKAPAVVSQCMPCHGPNGRSEYESWPSLAGQKPSYLLQQLQDFKSGVRQHPMMAPIVSVLSEPDMKTLADFFGKQPPRQPSPTAARGAMPAAGAACIACHDNAALPIEPYLHAQQAPYLVEQIKAFRDGTRKNATMQAMVQPLSDKDIDAIAEHFSTLAPIARRAPPKK